MWGRCLVTYSSDLGCHANGPGRQELGSELAGGPCAVHVTERGGGGRRARGPLRRLTCTRRIAGWSWDRCPGQFRHASCPWNHVVYICGIAFLFPPSLFRLRPAGCGF